jgi:hypothetical protein
MRERADCSESSGRVYTPFSGKCAARQCNALPVNVQSRLIAIIVGVASSAPPVLIDEPCSNSNAGFMLKRAGN